MTKSKNDILYKKKAYWFFSVRKNDSYKNLEREMTERLNQFCLSHMDSKWAMNPRVCLKEGMATVRVFVVMKNPMSLMSVKKKFPEADFQLNLKQNAVWQYLSCDDRFTKESFVYSENWNWGTIPHGITQVDDNLQRPISITIHTDNMYLVADEDLKEALKKSFVNL